MKWYRYSDPSGTYCLSETEILDRFWEYWKQRMRKAGKEDLISRELCIEDWVVVNWAQKVEAPE